MKYDLMTTIGLLVVFFHPFALGSTQTSESANPRIPIYYGLNDSHSRSWVQVTREGVIGITYFQRFENNEAEGTLLYKTIHPDGSENTEPVINGTRLEKSVLLYDSLSNPHIFVASSNDTDQIIKHHHKIDTDEWQDETVIHFHNEGGKFIYEISADTGPDHSFHLLILKMRSDIDSDDFMDAWMDSYLYYLTDATGIWQKELIRNYDMAYTYDMYIKSSIRQDIKIDGDGHAHITFSEQIRGTDDPSRLWYATNETGAWEFEIALDHEYGIRDDAGWFPSLCLDGSGMPCISCMYVKRVYTYSAQYCRLYLLKRLGRQNWQREIIADRDDGYYGGDGRDYTGALSHLVFDENNTPHVIFSDIASTHWPAPENQCLNVGNIRYGVFQDGSWHFTTIHRQPLPTRFFIATEMCGMCLIVAGNDTIHIIGQEWVITDENDYTCNLLHFYGDDVNNMKRNTTVRVFNLDQNYPNPLNPETTITYSIPSANRVTLKIFNSMGREVRTLVNEIQPIDSYTVRLDARNLPSGLYFYRLTSGNGFSETKKMVILH